MRTARLALLGLTIALLSACGASDLTAPQGKKGGPPTTSTTSCGYLGSHGCV